MERGFRLTDQEAHLVYKLVSDAFARSTNETVEAEIGNPDAVATAAQLYMRMSEATMTERMREVLDRFAEVHRWMIRNGHNPDDIDFLIRGPGGPEGQIMGHLQVQSDDFRDANDVLEQS